ncbi:MAG: hypothetical protein K6U09_10715 [Acidobacteriia bacterium]|nr:hypothetical protein [Terriglobia bacterium]
MIRSEQLLVGDFARASVHPRAPAPQHIRGAAAVGHPADRCHAIRGTPEYFILRLAPHCVASFPGPLTALCLYSLFL